MVDRTAVIGRRERAPCRSVRCAGWALLGEVRDDDLGDLAKKVSKQGGNTALLTATVIKPGLIITGGAKRFVMAQAYD